MIILNVGNRRLHDLAVWQSRRGWAGFALEPCFSNRFWTKFEWIKTMLLDRCRNASWSAALTIWGRATTNELRLHKGAVLQQCWRHFDSSVSSAQGTPYIDAGTSICNEFQTQRSSRRSSPRRTDWLGPAAHLNINSGWTSLDYPCVFMTTPPFVPSMTVPCSSHRVAAFLNYWGHVRIMLSAVCLLDLDTVVTSDGG